MQSYRFRAPATCGARVRRPGAVAEPARPQTMRMSDIHGPPRAYRAAILPAGLARIVIRTYDPKRPVVKNAEVYQLADESNKPAAAYLDLCDEELLSQCEVDAYRASGPGGQKRNKTSSAIRLRHRPTGLAVTAEEDRSQHVNKARAIRRLRRAIALHIRGEIVLCDYRPGPLVAEMARDGGRISVSRRDPRYYRIIHEVLDVFSACGMSLGEAAIHTGVKTGRLVKLFQTDPKLWERVNQMRGSAGLKPLR